LLQSATKKKILILIKKLKIDVNEGKFETIKEVCEGEEDLILQKFKNELFPCVDEFEKNKSNTKKSFNVKLENDNHITECEEYDY